MKAKNRGSNIHYIPSSSNDFIEQLTLSAGSRETTYLTLEGDEFKGDMPHRGSDASITDEIVLEAPEPVGRDFGITGLDDPQRKSKEVSEDDEEMADLMANMDTIQDTLFEFEFHADIGKNCECGRLGAARTVSCEDCSDPRLTCSNCFVDQHVGTPFHWARRWDKEAGFFSKVDISKVMHPKNYAIPLGHDGSHCPHHRGDLEPPDGVKFTVVDFNGIHGTRILFCTCDKSPPRHIQLVRAKMLPASVRAPETAATFGVLRSYRAHDLAAKGTAQDFLRATQRMTDNVLSDAVQVSQ